MKTGFGRAINFVLAQEGGDTKYGISQRAYPNVDISTLTIEDARRIYHRDYWEKLDLGELPHPVALAMLEAAINMGRRAAVKCLQRAANRLSGSQRLKVDGWLGDITKNAMLEMSGRHGGALALATQIAIGRLEFHCRLAANPNYARYLRGWGLRCVRLCNQLAQDWAETNME